ncbi:hypothetical protein WJX72_003224 [[Myrmecia] bisecta]|uniref:Uncharacterized protein n=1 Tax=[Myrmecia] bisecta TaxID=41462 RepID=A0AAW1QQZ1_9CHLO
MAGEAVSGRSCSLSHLGLEGKVVYAKGPSTVISARVQGQYLLYEGRLVTEEDFLGGGPTQGSVWRHIFSDRELTYSLADLATCSERYALKSGKAVENWLKDKYEIQSVADLTSLFERTRKGGVAFRVCRLEEDAEHGLKLRGAVSRGPLSKYLADLGCHIATGSRLPTPKPFRSATRNLRQALYWSYGGILPVIVVDLDKCADLGVRYWDVGGHQDFFLVEGMFRDFAKAFAEVVFDTDVPQEATTKLEVIWQAKQHSRILTSTETPRNTIFPKELLGPNNITVHEVLSEGSTQPLRVSLGNAKKACAEQQFVLKRGGWRSNDGCHTAQEFLALQMYSCAGIAVPPAALYTCRIRLQDDSLLPEGEFLEVLLTRFLNGERFDPTRGGLRAAEGLRSLQDGLVLDIAMANFDVAGPDFANLVVYNDQVYRADVNGALDY